MSELGACYHGTLKELHDSGKLQDFSWHEWSGSGIQKAKELRSSHEGRLLLLEALVDTSSHRVLDLRYCKVPSVHADIRQIHDKVGVRGRLLPQDAALLDALCQVMKGYTVQDCSEHAVLRLESMLRDRHQSRPVHGVVQPENADPGFALPLHFVRGLLQGYIKETGYKVQMNFEEGPVFQPSSEWGTSTVSERLQHVLKVIPEVCVETGIRRSDVTIKSLTGPRVTLALQSGAPRAAQQKYLTLLEMELRAKVDPRLEVFLDDKKDENTKRHTPCPA